MSHTAAAQYTRSRQGEGSLDRLRAEEPGSSSHFPVGMVVQWTVGGLEGLQSLVEGGSRSVGQEIRSLGGLEKGKIGLEVGREGREHFTLPMHSKPPRLLLIYHNNAMPTVQLRLRQHEKSLCSCHR